MDSLHVLATSSPLLSSFGSTSCIHVITIDGLLFELEEIVVSTVPNRTQCTIDHSNTSNEIIVVHIGIVVITILVSLISTMTIAAIESKLGVNALTL